MPLTAHSTLSQPLEFAKARLRDMLIFEGPTGCTSSRWTSQLVEFQGTILPRPYVLCLLDVSSCRYARAQLELTRLHPDARMQP
eukprot:6190909-Pleurochrysis_carterae.AAC.3